MIPSNTPVRHGYTIRDLDRLARFVVNAAFYRGLSAQDRYDEALSAIGLHLSAATEPPTPRELQAAGIRAVNDMFQREARHHGVDRDRPDAGGRPRFHAYWALTGVTPSHEDRVVDRVAFGQIWLELTPMNRATLLAFAEHEDHTAAMTAVGAKSRNTYKVNLKHARDRFLGFWHEGEEPSRIWSASMGAKVGSRPVTRVLADRRSRRERAA